MYVYVNVGQTGAGKTTFVKKKILNRLLTGEYDIKPFIFDPNGEYIEYGSEKNTSFKDFINECMNREKSLIVFEEATIFFRHGVNSEQIMNMLVRKRHTQNIIVLNFHALRQVPAHILDFTDYLTLFRTKDNPNIIYNRFKDYPEVIQLYEVLSSVKDEKYFNKTIQL